MAVEYINRHHGAALIYCGNSFHVCAELLRILERRWRSNRKQSLKQDEALISPDQSVPSRATPIITRLDCRFDMAAAMTQMKKGSILKKFENFVDVELLLMILAARCLHRDSHESDETKSDGIVQ